MRLTSSLLIVAIGAAVVIANENGQEVENGTETMSAEQPQASEMTEDPIDEEDQTQAPLEDLSDDPAEDQTDDPLSNLTEDQQWLHLCRKDPLWLNDPEKCADITGWAAYGRSTYWWRENYASRAEHLGEGKEEELLTCIQTKLRAMDWDARCEGTYQCDGWDPSIKSMYGDLKQGTLIFVEDVLTRQEAAAVDSLAACIHEVLPKELPHFEARAFGDDTQHKTVYDVGGGNYCTFVAGLVQMYLPGVASSIYRAIETAYDFVGWEAKGNPHPTDLGIRTSEFLEYRKTGHLANHEDGGSTYTISIMMSDPGEYGGGYFHLDSSEALFKLPKLSGIVFRSEDMHGITPILNGTRRVFVTELWDNEDAPIGEARPDAEQFEEYRERIRQEEEEAGFLFEVDFESGEEEVGEDFDDQEEAEEDPDNIKRVEVEVPANFDSLEEATASITEAKAQDEL